MEAREKGIIRYDFSSPLNKKVIDINVIIFPMDEILLIPAINFPLLPLVVISVNKANQLTVITAEANDIDAYTIISPIGPETNDNENQSIARIILDIISHGFLTPELSLNFPKNICMAFEIEFPRASNKPISIGDAPRITPYTPMKDDAVVAPEEIKKVLIFIRISVFP